MLACLLQKIRNTFTLKNLIFEYVSEKIKSKN